MQVKVEANLSKSSAALMAVGIHLNESLAKIIKELLGPTEAYAELAASVADVARDEGFKGKMGQVLSVPTYNLAPFKRLYLFGLGTEAEAAEDNYSGYRKMGVALGKRMQVMARSKDSGESDESKSKTKKNTSVASTKPVKTLTVASVCLCLRGKKSKGDKNESETALASIVEAIILSSYSYEKYKKMKEAGKQAKLDSQASLSHFNLSVFGVEKSSFERAVKKATAVGMAVNMARGLIAEPPSYMTPTRLAAEAKRIAKDYDLTCKVLDEQQIEKLQMGSFLGVARGAKELPRFIVLKYTAAKAKKTIALVGKGVTFDSGGLSLKTALGMEHMKYDMAGAASVMAAMQVIGQLKPRVSVMAVVPATENMPGSNALHPGDVLIAMNGKTIEVNNTDAEGRLILADALTYAIKEGADELIDIATLTGAVVSALGRVAAGIMGSDQDLIDGVIKAGVGSGEKYWQLPMFDEYKDALKSDIADLKNAGSRGEAGSSCAAMFLKEFTEDKPWAHLDIAGVAWSERERDEMTKGGTGFGIRTLCNYVMSQ